MTSRERVLAALNHEEPDRVPLDIGGAQDCSLTRLAYERVKRYLGQEIGDVQYGVFFTTMIYPDEEFSLTLGADCRSVFIPAREPDIEVTPDGRREYVDEYGQRRRESSRGYAWDVVDFPLGGNITVNDVERFNWNVIDMNAFRLAVDQAEGRAKALKEQTDFAVVANYTCSPMTFTQLLRGFDYWCMDVIDDPKLIEAMMDCYIDSIRESYELFFSRVGKYADVVFGLGDDVAMDSALFISPEAYRKYVKPRHARIISMCRKYTDAPFLFHCCGAMREIIPDLMEIGVNAITPVQVSSRGMDTKELKREFGKYITFWGSIDTRHVLPHGGRQEVEAEVKRRIRDLGRGGGFVAAAVHNIQPDVPPENVIALAEAVREYGEYPL